MRIRNFLITLLVYISSVYLCFSHANAYEINHSCRFNDDDSARLTRTFSTPTDRRKFTFSTWIKRANIGSRAIFDAYANGSNFAILKFNSSDQIGIYVIDGGIDYGFNSTTAFQDSTDWYHIHFVYDSANATANDRLIIHVNNQRYDESNASTSYGTLPQNHSAIMNTTQSHAIGRYTDQGIYLDGYLSETYYIDGQALPPSTFGESRDENWVPKDPGTLTFGNNGFHLDYADSSNLGNDVSSNNNHFTSSNITTDDQVSDTPTNNYCTLNPLDTDSTGNTAELKNGNLEIRSFDSGNQLTRATFAVTSGKWYWEITRGSDPDNWFGGIKKNGDSITTGTWLGNTNGEVSYQAHGSNGKIYQNGVELQNSLSAMGDGDILGVALNLEDNEIEFFINNVKQGSTVSIENSSWAPAYSDSSNVDAAYATFFNFGQLGFQYTPPTGFKALCSKNTDLPVLNEFTVDPNPIDYPNPSTLSWNVSSADTVFIEPEIGSVDLTGTRSILPPGNIIYTLTATNSNGTSKATVSVDVTGGYDASGNFTVFGNLGVGTINPQSKLEVNGTIKAKEVIVTLDGWPDFVFRENYDLPTLESVEAFIKKNNHLPGIPSESDIQSNGLPMAELLTKQMQKIEELTLYLIQIQSELKMKDSKIDELKLRIESLEEKTIRLNQNTIR